MECEAIDTKSYQQRNSAKQLSLLKVNKPKTIELTDRDLEILEFVIDMKFVSVEAVFKKFFRRTRFETDALSQAWAQKRLSQLEKAKFLVGVYCFSKRIKYYAGTFQSYRAVENLKTNSLVSKPTGRFDQRTFGHDKAVLDFRVFMEEKALISDWQSERILKSNPELIPGLTSSYVPDGIYTTTEGDRVAFELEIAVKAKARYQDKVKRYVQWIREHRNDPAAFKKVHYVVMSETVKKHLDYFTAIYQEFFKVELADGYLKESAGLK